MASDQIMIDLETLGVKDGAAIISIGAVRFDLVGSCLGASFYAKIALDSDHFGEIDGSTVGWWMAQDPEAIKEAFFGSDRVELQEALDDFELFLALEPVTGLWSKGPTFDEVLIRSAWDRCDMGDFPISFRYSRDVRTAEMFCKEDIPFEGVKHNALADAKHQAKVVQRAFSRNLV